MLRLETGRYDCIMGNKIQTFSGLYVDPLNMRIEDIVLEDIAHALAMKCRFNGHSLEFYSVGDHSIRCCRYLGHKYRNIQLALCGLFHDLSETFAPDMPRPLKDSISGYREAEDAILKIGAEKFGFQWPMPKEYKEADEVILALETRDLMGHDAFGKWGKKHLKDYNAEQLAETYPKIIPMSPSEAEFMFKVAYKHLLRGEFI